MHFYFIFRFIIFRFGGRAAKGGEPGDEAPAPIVPRMGLHDTWDKVCVVYVFYACAVSAQSICKGIKHIYLGFQVFDCDPLPLLIRRNIGDSQRIIKITNGKCS